MTRPAALGIAVVSTIYFIDTCYRASQKCFWYDELFTWYLCHLPRFRDTWAGVTQGADFNPPLFYLLTRGSQSLFGQGLVATRLPATIGVWVFCVCLYLFVARRAGPLGGFIAATFPLFTLVQYYSYEARAHGISLGWCGLALVCWQRHSERRTKGIWLIGFACSLAGALLTHVYAVYLIVPFVLVESYCWLRNGRADWGVLGVLAIVFSSIVGLVFLPLVRGYRNAAMPVTFFPVSYGIIQQFVMDILGPATPFLLMSVVLAGVDLAFGAKVTRRSPDAPLSIPDRDFVVAFGFLLVPLAGWIGCKVTHGPFIDRYFLSAVAGFSIFLGFLNSRRQSKGQAKALAGFILLWMVADLGSAMYLGGKHRIVLFEPSSHYRLTTNPHKPMMLYETLSEDESGMDILVTNPFDYLYLFHYTSPDVASRLYFGAPAADVWFALYRKWAAGTLTNLRLTEYQPFLATHEHFFLYESGGTAVDAKQEIAKAGYRFNSVSSDSSGVLYAFTK